MLCLIIDSKQAPMSHIGNKRCCR